MGYPPEVNKKYLNERYAAQRADLIARLGGVCTICGSTEKLEIDHVEWNKKSFNVGALWPTKKLPLVHEELKKCQLLCREHHEQKSSADMLEIIALRPPFRHGTIYGFMRMKCKCSECAAAKDAWNAERNRKRKAERQGTYTRGPYKPRKPRD